jgi:hypothetical protein
VTSARRSTGTGSASPSFFTKTRTGEVQTHRERHRGVDNVLT